MTKLDEEINGWLEHGEITDTRYDDYDDNDIEATARHFAEWQMEQMKKSLLEWAKEQHDHFHEREKDEIADGSNPDAIFFSGKCDAFKSLIDKLQSL